ncbi:LysR substrate-binding domain-containing protein [Novosphingobium sp. ST904]|nr:LysR substrate-binding domain-containing protein [Novosphingobium sp. ST904]
MLALGETRKEGATTCLSVNLPVALAAAPTYLARQGHPRSPAELGGAAHIRHLDADGPRPILFANGSMLTPAGIFDTDSIEAMRIGAVKGLGIASIPRILIEEDLHSGRLVEIVPHAPLAPVALHMSHCFGRFPPRRASLFAKFVQSLLMPRTASA